MLNGQTDAGFSLVDASPIVMAAAEWCIGSYGGGGFWTDRALTDAEIQQVSARGCCLP